MLVLTPAGVRAQNVTESGQRAQADESQLDDSGISTPIKTSGRSTAVSPSSVVEAQAGGPLLFSPTVANSEESVYASQYLYLSQVTDDELDAISSEAAAAACASPAKGATPLSTKACDVGGDAQDEDAASPLKRKASKKETDMVEKTKKEEERVAKKEEAEREKAAKTAMKEASRVAKKQEAEREKAERAAKKEAEKVKKEEERATKKEAEKVKKEEERAAKMEAAERETAAKARRVPEPDPDVGVTPLQREAMVVGSMAPKRSSSSPKASALRAPWQPLQSDDNGVALMMSRASAASSPSSTIPPASAIPPPPPPRSLRAATPLTPSTPSAMKHHLHLQLPTSPGPVSLEPSFPYPPSSRATVARRLTTKLINGRSTLMLLVMVGLFLLLFNAACATNVNAFAETGTAKAAKLAEVEAMKAEKLAAKVAKAAKLAEMETANAAKLAETEAARAEKLAAKAAKAAKLAETETAKAAKLAQMETDKAAKLAQMETAQAAKLAQMEIAKAAKLAEMEAAKAANVAEKEAAKAANVAEKEAKKAANVAEQEAKRAEKFAAKAAKESEKLAKKEAVVKSAAEAKSGSANLGSTNWGSSKSTAAWNPLWAADTRPQPIATALASEQMQHRIKWALMAASYVASAFIGGHLRLTTIKAVSAGRAPAMVSVIGRGAGVIGRGTVNLLSPLRVASKALGQRSRHLGKWALAAAFAPKAWSYPLWSAIYRPQSQTTTYNPLHIVRSSIQRAGQLKVSPPPGAIRSPLTLVGSAAGGRGLWPWMGAAILGFLTI